MADVIRKATNKFTKGLVMDFSPENTRNEVLTHALNATFLTFNGNELSLQNDMGNGRVETAFLPEGYMPVGTCEYGGIIYIVSYNPLEDKSQIGCFPSPERNISSDELGQSEDVTLNTGDFQILNSDNIPTGDLKNTSKYVLLRNDNLNPGDKFIINSDTALYNEALLNLQKSKDNGIYQDVPNPVIALNVVSIEDSGRIIYLNSDLRDYEKTISTDPNISVKYHILGERSSANLTGKIDLDSYRNVLSSGYNVFKSKTSGKLAILAELVTIDSYSVTHSVVPKKITIEGVTQNHEGHYDVIIHTEVEPQVTTANYNTVPKLSYYHLENSQGYLQTYDNEGGFELFTPSGYLNERFLGINLKNVLTPTDTSNPINLDQLIGDSGKFNFPKKDTYHGRMAEHSGLITEYEGKEVYTKFSEDKYHRVAPSQVKASDNISFKAYFTRDLQAKFYRYNPSNTGYTKWENTTLDNTKTYYVATTEFAYVNAERNPEYKGSVTLYNNVSEYKIANSSIINDSSIEKYQEVKVYTATEASAAELADYERVTLYQKTESGYQQLTGRPLTGVTYYTVEVATIMQYVGNSIVEADYQHVELFYCPGNKIYREATEKELEQYWDFNTYPEGTPAPIVLYYRKNQDTYKLATETEMLNFVKDSIVLYYKNDYELIIGDKTAGILNSGEPIFVVVPMDSYVPASEFTPSTSYNYIQGCTKPKGSNEPADGYPKDDPIVMCSVTDFVPMIYNEGSDSEVVEQYPDLKLGGIKIPGILTAYGIDLPFKYSYTITPCMNYGKLKHLSVSNTVDFSNLHAFEQSNFTEWRYHIDGNQLRLTFGAEIFDTHEDYKADGLILEFYDLCGFAGSLEINNRKSYSGTFTKLLSLNTLGGLSTRRILNGSYDSNFKRNVNIYQTTDNGNTVFKYLDQTVAYSNEGGWTGISDEDNDCGVLYSNLIYGVKAYIRRTTDKGIEFIHKKDYFLFTLPIYNDYYYTITDFSTLVNPKLEMQLTYKLVDTGNRTTYSGNGITNGYSATDSSNMSKFTSNSDFQGDSLKVTKYYQYKGASNLYLEVGLREVYKDMNIVYDPAINQYFKCELQLVGESNSTDLYTIHSQENSLLDTTSILSYKHTDGTLPLTLNKFGFTTSHSGKLPVSDLRNKRFITFNGSDPVIIDYNFVVGYGIDMSDIVLKEYPVTTICALCHETDTGEMNYSDFNISKRADGSNVERYLHDGIIYNAGTRNKRKVGVASQQNVTGNAEAQISSISQDFTEEGKEMSAGKANSGEIMKSLLPFIGKLSFCQPHAHAIYPEEGVSVHGNTSGANGKYSSGHSYYLIPPNYGGKKLHDSWSDSYDDTWGSIPATRMFDTPLYNMVINTENSIKLQSEFISSMPHTTLTQQALYGSTSDGWVQWQSCGTGRAFVGLTGAQLASFNDKLMKTMEGVYAYNPDYNTHKVLSGNTTINDLRVQVVSNILNKYSEFAFTENKTLNDYIYIGNVQITSYLNRLQQYSNIKVKQTINGKEKWLDSLQFLPDLTYCGTSDYPYLITSLTYNFVSDTNMISDFNSEKLTTVVRMSDKTIIPISGTVNPNYLYGYNKDLNCLWMLDVANYKINSSGSLECVKPSILKDNTIVHVTKSHSWYTMSTTGYTASDSTKCIRGTTLTINDLVYKPNEEHRLYVRNGCYQYNSAYRSKLFYGTSTIYLIDSGKNWNNWGNTKGDWSMSDVEKNVMFIANGPGFDPNKL